MSKIVVHEVNVQLGEIQVLKEISLAIEEDCITCLIGANGSGKTTLLKAIAGLVPVAKGYIVVDGKDIRDISLKDRAKLIAYLPQSRTISDIQVYSLITHGRFPHLDFLQRLKTSDKDLIDKAITMTNTEPLLNKKTSELSGGERQRVYLAMAIAQDTDIILLDEPTTYLDINYQIEVIQIIENLRQMGKTIVMVAHDLPQALTSAKRTCLLEEGRVLWYGESPEICDSHSLTDVFQISMEQLPINGNDLYSYKMIRRRQSGNQ